MMSWRLLYQYVLLFIDVIVTSVVGDDVVLSVLFV